METWSLLCPLGTLPALTNGTQKSWDFMKTHDSVTILLFNSSQRSLVLVKQFRPAVYASEVERHFPGSLAAMDQDRPQVLPGALPGSVGVTYELCAGLVDQPGLSLEEVACREAWEECGYRLAPSDLRRVATYKSLRKLGLETPQTAFPSKVQAWPPAEMGPQEGSEGDKGPEGAGSSWARSDRCPAGRPGRRPGGGGRAHRGHTPAPGWRPGLCGQPGYPQDARRYLWCLMVPQLRGPWPESPLSLPRIWTEASPGHPPCRPNKSCCSSSLCALAPSCDQGGWWEVRRWALGSRSVPPWLCHLGPGAVGMGQARRSAWGACGWAHWAPGHGVS
ncbi:uridine diphosphate glucose pyrophosphatase NUDT14 isoform X2 [Rhinolophus sinicus]|uniref:uridine diphosphate glucose pyrophosphatase NUDT14 isoform X2 n=1 Tax=Rhinolophus sinicus TaxID=89399 RepID=UPI003D7A92A1